ncbi:MAG: hypothetical protein NTX49_09745 [Chlamydiae bacterium]|nr:hypothetical protein [Chlamydiota bacterium]
MKRLFFLFLFLTSLIRAEFDSRDDEENPALFHHVNVITGDLNVILEDTVVQGAKTLPIIRTYSSAGALERDEDDIDLYLKRVKRGFIIQGGWSYFPHTHMLIRPGQRAANYTAYIADKSGAITTYEFSNKGGKHEVILKAKPSSSKTFGKISGKDSKDKSYLRLHELNGEATLYLADGSQLHYEGRSFRGRKMEGAHLTTYYALVKEELPSKHKILYDYDGKGRLLQIRYVNPSESKTFSYIKLNLECTSTPYRFQAHTSDGKEIDYCFMEFKNRDYLENVGNKWGIHQHYGYSQARGGIGARINEFCFDGKSLCKISYYLPENKKEDKLWEKKPDKKSFSADKVRSIEGPLGPSGEVITYASFTYHSGLTEVRDSESLLTQYFHENGHLTLIQYFDKQGQYTSSMKFLWSENKMTCKAKLDQNKAPLFSKTFSYDQTGNITEETFWGNITGSCPGPYTLESNGALSNAESFTRTYCYDPSMNVLTEEREENGLTYNYQYKPGTNLLTAKWTSFEGKILLREFFIYNEDHLLTEEISDDGCGNNSCDLSCVSERKIKRYDLDSQNGLPLRVTESALDLGAGTEKMIKRVDFGYSPQKRINSEAVYDSLGTYCYTIYTDYDEQGNVLRKTTPTGEENTYIFDKFGNLIESKEVGQPRKKTTYDLANRPTMEKEIDFSGHETIKTFSYDSKGKLLFQTDSQGRTTKQNYDTFGQCISSELSEATDESGDTYTPQILFSYDAHGNLASTTNPKGEVTYTEYTSLRKPYRIIHADGAVTSHVYNKNETLKKTIHPDGTEEHFKYDYFRRLIKKSVISARGDLLQQESSIYNAFHLAEHTDERGLTTNYYYDPAGRLIEERSEDRSQYYSYDPLGFLERTYQEGACQVQIHDYAGKVVAKWNEDSYGHIENKISYTYDDEGRRILAERITSKGKTEDRFTYDGKGRLSLHIDPLLQQTRFIYTDNYLNKQGLQVLQKKTIDPLGLIKIEIFDMQNHLAEIVRQDANGETVGKEQLFYDRAGNTAKKISTVYVDNKPTTTHSISWDYDICGRLVQQTESDKKTYSYRYNTRGWITEKIFPSGRSFSYEYDGLGRLIVQRSSDNTIHYVYTYGQGESPVMIEDLTCGSILSRKYNLFGAITEEISCENFSYKWAYDSRGRCASFILPDSSSINYEYSDLHLQSVIRHKLSGDSYEHTYEQFDPNGHIEKESLINHLGVITTDRDLLERPLHQISPWHTCTLSYGASGLVTHTSNTLFGDKTYQYDALNQLLKEGEKDYHFDSIGNPTNSKIGACNEIITTPEFEFTYDEDGRPTSKKSQNTTLYYEYDALDRLRCIQSENGGKTLFSYDAFSRLTSKETPLGKKLYLYNQEWEIGSTDSNKEILELKVLGLGIKGDIGATIAIELKNEVFAPLHDFNGNIVALIAPNREIIESYDLDAFGLETLQGEESLNNPWRFCSKRFEENLIFFGLRFYDPSIGRWLTPDPTGFSDGPNLYVYVLNSPINRLDLFGLTSEGNFFFPTAHLEVPIHMITSNIPTFKDVTSLKGSIDGVNVDWLVKGGNWSKIKFSQEELNCGKINLFNHFHEMFPSEGGMIGLVSLQNGIQTTLKETRNMIDFTSTTLPKDTLVMSLYSPSGSVWSDLNQAGNEIANIKETPMVALTRQYFTAISTSLCKVNPELLWMHIAHSRGGGIAARAAEGMTAEQKKLMQKNLIYLGVAPTVPMAKSCALMTDNVYSDKDTITGKFGKKFINNSEYNITFIECETTWMKRLSNPLFSDHAYLGKTYSKYTNDTNFEYNKDIGFFNGSIR